MRGCGRWPAQESKTCARCGEHKNADQFYKTGAGRLRHACKICYSDHNREMRKKHLEKRNKYEQSRPCGWERTGRSKYKAPEPERWALYILRVYKITADQYRAMLDAQGGVCAICKTECNRSTTTRMCVDHCHDTGKVRGLLCFKCNSGLGKFNDDQELLRSAAKYLENRK